MSYCVFSGADDNEGFKEWLRANRGGFYLNLISSTEGMIHAVGCDHLWDKDFDTKQNLTRATKVASLSVDELRTYAKDHRIELNPCHRRICP